MSSSYENHDFELPVREASKLLAIGGAQKKRWRYPECSDAEYATVSLGCRLTEVDQDIYEHDKLLQMVDNPDDLRLACGDEKEVIKVSTTLTYEPDNNREFFWRGVIIIPRFRHADWETYLSIWRAAVPGKDHVPHLLSSRRLNEFDDCLQGKRFSNLGSERILVVT